MKLPSQWTLAQLGELTSQIVGGGTPSKTLSSNFSGTIPFMTVKDMKARYVGATVDHISEDALSNSSTTMVPADTLIVATRMSLGKVARPKVDVAINQDLKAIFLRQGIEKTYIEYFWRSKSQAIQAMGTGTTVKGIRLEDVRTLSVPLAPQEEQKRIADKLDTVLTRVDAVNTRLARVGPILKRFRQSVLAAATSGRLTEDWRKPSGSSYQGESGLPSTWKVVTASDVCVSVRDGTHDTPVYVEQGVPLVTSKNIGPGGIDFSNAKLISTQDHLEISKRSAVSRGDVLISMIGTVGQVCLVDTDEVFSIKNVGLFKTSAALCMPRYLFYWFQSPQYSVWLQQNMRGGNQKFISLGLLRKSLVHEPPLQEQTEIVRRVETLFAFADRLEARLQTAQTATERLTPALLAKAFCGELVPQDPNDEPASELLKRLATQSPASLPNGRRGKRSAAVAN